MKPVHYFTLEDLVAHFTGYDVVDTGIVKEKENHGNGPHVHKLRYIMAVKRRG